MSGTVCRVASRPGVWPGAFLLLLLTAPSAGAQPAPSQEGVYKSVFTTSSGFRIRCTISVPDGYRHESPVPLVLSLHPGFRRSEPFPEYLGGSMLKALTAPGLDKLGALIVAPDSHGKRWDDPEIVAAVLDLIAGMRESYSVDPTRIAVLGYGMGGRGAWFFGANTRDLFTAVIPIGARVDLETAMAVRAPLFVIHGRRDERIPIASVEKTVAQLQKLGRRVDLLADPELGRFQVAEYAKPLRRAVPWLKDVWSSQPGHVPR